jgi:hypothetical protein
MAVRTATRRWADLDTFLREFPSTLKVQALVLPAECFAGDEAAPELKVDLILPLVGRVGPVSAQVIARMPDGGVATRLPDVSPAVEAALRELFGHVEGVKRWLVATRQVVLAGAVPVAATPFVDPAELAALRGRVRELEAALEVSRALSVSGLGSIAPGSDVDGAVERPRGLVVPDVSQVAPILSGKFGDESFRDALMVLAGEHATGLLTIDLVGQDGVRRTRWGFWYRGGPVGWRAEPIDEQEVLGVLLYRAGRVTQEQLEESLARMDARGCRQGEALVDMGVVPFGELVLLLQRQSDFVLQRVLREERGSWTFHVLPDLPERFLAPPLRVPSLLFRALVQTARAMAADELTTALRPWQQQFIYVADGADAALSEMKFGDAETQFLKLIAEKPWRLREVFSVSNLSRGQTAVVLWCLAKLNLVEFRTEGAAARTAEEVARVLDQRARQAASSSPFDRLGVHWICTAADVAAAWRAADVDFGPASVAARWGKENAERVALLHAAFRAAYGALSDDTRRRELRAGLVPRTTLVESAELLSKKGGMAVMKGDAREGSDCYAKASELVPGEREYQEGLARARALLAGG